MRESSGARRRRGVLLLAVLLAVPLAAAARADAFIYWIGPNAAATGSQISRANLDGSGIDATFIETPGFTPDSLALDGRFIYWANGVVPMSFRGAGSIARAALNGSAVNEDLLSTDGSPGGVAVHGAYLYWTQPAGIWRARKGRGRIRAVTGGPHRGHTYYPFAPSSLAFDRTHVYWGDNIGRIGRANLNGSHVTYALIRSVDPSGGIVIAGNHIYWFSKSGEIGRANLNGSNADPNFITTGISAGDETPCGLAAYRDQIYWIAYSPTGSPAGIGRAGLNGSAVTSQLISTSFTCGLAVGGGG